jgi:hypothetical protein
MNIKDTLWTSTNGGFAVPGCRWSPDHEAPAAELHVVIALMTTGPVGISDGINFTNVPLILRTIAEDGTLLKPSKPITSVDSALSSKAPPGYVYTTYSGIPMAPAKAHYFVSFKMTDVWTLTARDFYPALPLDASVATRVWSTEQCVDGSKASDCVDMKSVATRDSPVAVVPKSDARNVTGGTDFAPAVTTVWTLCKSGYDSFFSRIFFIIVYN